MVSGTRDLKYYTILYHTILYSTIPYYTMLYSTILGYTRLYYTGYLDPLNSQEPWEGALVLGSWLVVAVIEKGHWSEISVGAFGLWGSHPRAAPILR